MKQEITPVKAATYLSWIVAAILIMLPFHAFFTTWATTIFGDIDLVRVWKELIIIAIMPGTVWLAWQAPGLRAWLLNSWLVRFYLIYLALYLSRGAWALSVGSTNNQAYAYSLIVNLRFIGFFIICFLLAHLSKFLYQNWPKILLAPAAAVVSFGLLQKLLLPLDFLRHFGYGPDTIPTHQLVDKKIEYPRLQSTLRGPNPLGAYLVLIITAVFGVLNRKRLWLVGALLACSFVLFFSYSRSAWIGAVLSLGSLAFLSQRKTVSSRRLLLALLALLSLITLSIFSLRNSDTAQDTFFHTSEVSSSAKSSNEVRGQALKNGIKDIIHEPLGRGAGTAGPASARTEQPRIAENYFLQVGQEVGVAGMIIFLIINLIVAHQLWLRRQDLLARVLLASLVGLTFINLVSHAWTDDTISLLWWGLAGIALTIPAAKSKKQ